MEAMMMINEKKNYYTGLDASTINFYHPISIAHYRLGRTVLMIVRGG